MEGDSSLNLTAPEGFPLPPKRDPLYIVVPITIAYTVIFFSGITGNVITCVVIARNKHMHTATNYYLYSLAVSDLLLLVSGLPQEIYSIWSRYPYIFGEVFCVLRGLAAETSANATVLTITAFTVERYVAICHPFFAHTLSKLSRAIRLILVIWAVALAFAVPQALQFGVTSGKRPDQIQCVVIKIILKHSFEISTFLFFALPMTIITVLYALIGLRLRRSALLKKSSGSFSHHQEANRSTCRSTSSRRVLKMLVAVVVAFFICWAPFHAQRLVAIYGVSDHPASPLVIRIYDVVTYMSGILYYVSTTVNPILYHIMSLKFREAFKDSLSWCCCLKGRQRSYAVLSRQQRSLAMLNSKSLTDSAPSQSEIRDRRESAVKRQVSESSYMLTEGAGASVSWETNKHTVTIASPHSNVSNSSLWDADSEELNKELSLYMMEISKQHTTCLDY